MLCEPDAKLRAQLRWFIADDPALVLAAEAHGWAECEAVLDDIVPELLIIGANLLPSDWGRRVEHESFSPLVVSLGRQGGANASSHIHLDISTPPDGETIRRLLDRAVREIYDRKTRELLYLVNRYVEASGADSAYRTTIKVEREGQFVELETEKIMAVVAARKCVSIHSREGTFLLREPIHLVASTLDPAMFIRIHRSVIINARYLDFRENASARGAYAVLIDGTRYPIGPNFREAIADLVPPR